MKATYRNIGYRILSLAVAMMTTLYTFAQDAAQGGGSQTVVEKSSTSTSQSSWYTMPWVWLVGAAVFILLLVALVRGGNSKSESISQ